MITSIMQLKWGLFHLIEGDFISNYAKTYGEWSETEVQILLGLVNETSNIIEVGSNIGLHSVPLAKKILKGKLFCFEPQRIIHQTLCANISLNRLTNVYTYQQGVGADNQLLELQSSRYDQAWNYGSYSINKGFSTESDFTGEIHYEYVPIISLDNHAEINKLDTLSLLKIDAEGFELKVLDGAKHLIARHSPFIFIEAHYAAYPNLLNYFTALGYQCYWVISNRYQQNNYFKAPKSLFGLDFNFLCVPPGQKSPLPESLLVKPNQPLNELPLVHC